MKHTWLVGAVASMMVIASVTGNAQTPQSKPTTQKPAETTQKPADMEKPKPATRAATQKAPAEVPTGETVLGTITIPRSVTADGKALAGGRYTVRLTAATAQPTVAGQVPNFNRWVEFVQGKEVRGREVVSIIPIDEEDDTQQGPDLTTGRPRVPRGSSRVEALKGGEYIRVWFNRGGHHYLVHLPPQGAAR